MVGTRFSIEESQQTFQTLLTEILGLDLQSLNFQSLIQESIYMMTDLLALRDGDIKNFQYSAIVKVYNQIQTAVSFLSKVNKGWVIVLIAFIKNYNVTSEVDFEEISMKEFNHFRLSIYTPNIC